MKFDQQSSDQERDLMKMWQDSSLPESMDAAQIVREIAGKVEKFDRTIWWRNFREYAAGVILLLFFAWKSFNPAARFIAMAGIAAVGFVMIYLWWSHSRWSHSRIPALDPAADGRAYKAALLDRYDRQIRLLSGVKYWYVLPLYLWMLLSIVLTVPSHETGSRIRRGLVVTVFAVLVAWLNEGYAARKLRDKRKKAAALLEEEKNEE